MRLGDLDALKKDLKQYFSDGTLDSVSAKLAFNMILRKIDNAPTVEPRIEYGTDGQPYILSITNGIEERPKGEWIVIHNALGETKYQCNQCQHFVKPGDDKNFCPNCGLPMKKGGAE